MDRQIRYYSIPENEILTLMSMLELSLNAEVPFSMDRLIMANRAIELKDKYSEQILDYLRDLTGDDGS